jgi:hypothetical protein
LTRDNIHLYFSGAPMLKGIVHREDFRRVEGFDGRFYGVEDFYFFVKLLTIGVEVELVDDVRGFYREHSHSVTNQIRGDRRGIDSWLLMYETMPNELDLSTEVEQMCREALVYWKWRRMKLNLRHALKSNSVRPRASRSVLIDVKDGLVPAARMLASSVAYRWRGRSSTGL